MNKKRRVRIDRLIILILVALLILLLSIFGIYKLVGLFINDKNNKKDNIVTNVVSDDSVKVSINDYTIYYDDKNDLGFSFIIASIRFDCDKPFNFALSSLQTSEKVYLNDVSKYINKLEMAGYDLAKLNLVSNVVMSDKNSIDCNIFIPYSTDASNLSVYNITNNLNSIMFDLSKDKVLATILKLDNQNEEIVVGNTSVYVSKAYISNFMLHNDEPYEISSTSRMYSFEIGVKDAKDSVKITDAIFIKNGGDEQINCKAKDYKANDMNNILDTELVNGVKGGLFFEVYSNEDSVEDGILLIKFSNQSEWVEISTKVE